MCEHACVQAWVRVCVCVCRVLELAQLSLVVRLHGLRPVRGQRSKGDFRAGMNHQQQAPSLAHVVPRRGRIVSWCNRLLPGSVQAALSAGSAAQRPATPTCTPSPLPAQLMG